MTQPLLLSWCFSSVSPASSRLILPSQVSFYAKIQTVGISFVNEIWEFRPYVTSHILQCNLMEDGKRRFFSRNLVGMYYISQKYDMGWINGMNWMHPFLHIRVLVASLPARERIAYQILRYSPVKWRSGRVNETWSAYPPKITFCMQYSHDWRIMTWPLIQFLLLCLTSLC